MAATEHYYIPLTFASTELCVKDNRNEMEFLFCGVVILLSSSFASVSGTILFLLLSRYTVVTCSLLLLMPDRAVLRATWPCRLLVQVYFSKRLAFSLYPWPDPQEILILGIFVMAFLLTWCTVNSCVEVDHCSG